MKKLLAIIAAMLVILVAIYGLIPPKNIFEITGWGTDTSQYTKIKIRQVGADEEGRVITKVNEFIDQDLMDEIINHLKTYELKRWYSKKSHRLEPYEKTYDIYFEGEESGYRSLRLLGNYAEISSKGGSINYRIKKQNEIEKNYLGDLLEKNTAPLA